MKGRDDLLVKTREGKSESRLLEGRIKRPFSLRKTLCRVFKSDGMVEEWK